ncbi:hypothetical protein DY000_02013979 [Brassica cretica]|uniref:Uncharacterized protein n=1 Tax=Brassica cretica TaxID=69181 RepID=A0ABQ7DAC1_BRACR|nr:hypothetical protein DY000_02013979 [Brassica cretica]
MDKADPYTRSGALVTRRKYSGRALLKETETTSQLLGLGFPSPIEGLGLDYDISFDWDGDSHRLVYLCFEAISSPHEGWRNTHSLGLAKKWNGCNLRLEDFGVG